MKKFLMFVGAFACIVVCLFGYLYLKTGATRAGNDLRRTSIEERARPRILDVAQKSEEHAVL
jgi:hypothetical protein